MKDFTLNQQTRSRGQGMTEYIIIVALLAIGAIGAYSFFGETVRGQVATMAGEMTGDGSDGRSAAETAAGKTVDAAGKNLDLSNFESENTN